MPTILIIEDHEKLALFTRQFLEKKGLQADIASDGVKALQAFAKGSYDLLIVNLKLPIMDGEALCAKVRASGKGRDIPIIMMSGVVKSPAEIEAITARLGLALFLTKPFSFDLLWEAVTTVLPREEKETAPPPRPAAPPAQPAQPATVKGRLDEKPFDLLLAEIAEREVTGALSVIRGESRKKFFIVKGAPAGLIVSPEKENFGNYLLGKGLISMVELRAYEERKKGPVEDPRTLFIKMGCLTPERFREEHINYLTENLSTCFAWVQGTYLFEPRPSFIPEFYGMSAELPRIFFRGYRDSLTPARTEAFLNRKGRFYLRKTEAFFDYQNHLADIPLVDSLFNLLDGTKTCSDIINSTDIKHETALALFLTLDRLKMVHYSPLPEKIDITPPFPVREREVKRAGEEAIALTEEFEDLGEELSLLSDELEGIETLHQQPAETAAAAAAAAGEERALEEELRATWERIKGKNYYEIFGLTRNSYSFNSVKSAYFELTRKFSPDKFFASSGEIMDLDQELLAKVSEAYETLSNVVSKENYDEALDSQEAVTMEGSVEDKQMKIQVQFTSGKVFLEEGQYDSAEKCFTNLVNMAPEKPEFLAYLALSVYNNPSHRRSAPTVARTKELINKSLALGKLSIAYALKGTILFDEGNLSLAEAEFNKALKINPSNRTAVKKLEEIRERREQEKGGILKRMFK